jgi:hypothetical protein
MDLFEVRRLVHPDAQWRPLARFTPRPVDHGQVGVARPVKTSAEISVAKGRRGQKVATKTGDGKIAWGKRPRRRGGRTLSDPGEASASPCREPRRKRRLGPAARRRRDGRRSRPETSREFDSYAEYNIPSRGLGRPSDQGYSRFHPLTSDRRGLHFWSETTRLAVEPAISTVNRSGQQSTRTNTGKQPVRSDR